jgi:neutral ceramidase
MGSDLVKMRVVDALAARLPGLYSTDNVCISGTHTHSGPAGFLQYTLFQITSWGFVPETFDAWVEGITAAIVMAHENQRSGKILLANGELDEANINRSPSSYLENPEEERAQYNADTDKNMLLLKLVADDGGLIGVINWFSVHGTSMNNTNTLVSGDNKGYASYLLEKNVNGASSTPGMGPFVAAFGSTNLGDVSPNTAGPMCIDTGEPCAFETSSCNGKCENCIASGPGKDMWESTEIIGRKQYDHSLTLLDAATEEVSGPVDFRHSFVDMPALNVEALNMSLCRPSMGYSFAAGTTDGPGMMNFTQGTVSGNPFWDKVRDFLSEPTEEEIACQAPKPILFNTGDMFTPYQWDPDRLPLQVFRVGNVFIVAPPSEFTTMSGRRLRNALTKVIEASGALAAGQKAHIAIAGLSNSYSSYVTTYEEFQAQRYEAASTLFGPHTLEGYIQEFSRITNDLVTGQETATGPAPPDLTSEQITLSVRKFPFDRTPHGTSFGDVVEGGDVLASYSTGDSAVAVFHSANPRNDQRIQDTYLTVEKEGKLGVFHTVAVDGDWETKFHWTSGKEDVENIGLSGVSRAQITWAIPDTASTGTYRICHHGNRKMALNEHSIVPFSGCSSNFEVLA